MPFIKKQIANSSITEQPRGAVEMLRRLSGAIRTGLAELDSTADANSAALIPQPLKFSYSRPHYLSLSLESDEVTHLAGYNVSRPILVAGDKAPLPGMAGYAEAINAGKSQRNEDQGQVCQFWLRSAVQADPQLNVIMYNSFVCNTEDYHVAASANAESTLVTYFALFDGHAGDGAATYARHRLQLLVKDRLQQVYPLLLAAAEAATSSAPDVPVLSPTGSYQPSLDELVIGALESAFIGLDEEICRERSSYFIKGGCTALLTLFLLGRVYIANAGDSRAVLCRRDGTSRPLTIDQTPYNDRQRIQSVAAHHPELLGREFCPVQFNRRLGRRDIGRRVLCRHERMQGWFIKTATDEDMLFPLITGDARKSRLLATIGVARGFGDHSLMVSDTRIAVKPFLSCVPLVTVIDSADIAMEGGNNAFVVMATDGLWDVLSNEAAGSIVQESAGLGAGNRLVL